MAAVKISVVALRHVCCCPGAKKPGTSKDPQAEIVVKRTLIKGRAPQQPDIPAKSAYIASDDDLPAELFDIPVPVAEEV
jgi:hypothetical protein